MNILYSLKKIRNSILVKNKPKIFCIGQNKTGTTSIKKAFEQLGYVTGDQREAEKLLIHYSNKNFQPIISYCKSAQVFQDFPFSYPQTYKYLDDAYPGSKFILTVRNDAEQWYNSLVKFHSNIFGNGKLPTSNQLKDAEYVCKGWAWQAHSALFNCNEADPYSKQVLISCYNDYNSEVKQYFQERHDDFIIINLAENNSYQKLLKFLRISSPFSSFPWENQTLN